MVKLDINTKPDLNKAIRHQNLTCPRIKDKEGKYNKLSVVDFKTEDMSRFGVGVLLYFQFMEKMTYILILLSFLSLPCLVINILASSKTYPYGPDAHFTFAQFSYAGWGYNTNTTTVLIPGFEDYISDSLIDRNALGVSYSAIDVFYSIVFLICVYYLNKHQSEETLRVDKEKGYIDLSKRRVAPEEVAKCNLRWTKSKNVDSIMRRVAKELEKPLIDLNTSFTWPLYAKYGHASDAFKSYMK